MLGVFFIALWLLIKYVLFPIAVIFSILGVLYYGFKLFIFYPIKKRIHNFSNNRFKRIFSAFFYGVYVSLRIRDMDKLYQKICHRFDSFPRGFAFEGAGFGLAFRSSFAMNKGMQFEKLTMNLSSSSMYQYYIGLGLFMHLRYRFKPEAYQRWLDQIDENLGPILFDGMAFKECLFRYKRHPHIIKKFDRLNPAHRRICYQGFGRSLWYIYRFSLERALKEVDKVESTDRPDVLSGLGFAVAYSHFDHINDVFRTYNQIPVVYQSTYIQGIVFGLEARRQQDELYLYSTLNRVSTVRKKMILSWLKAAHAEKKSLTKNYNFHFYTSWMDQTRGRIASSLHAK